MARGRAAGIFHARERAGQYRAALRAGDDEAEAVERMRHLRSTKAERHRGRGRVRDLAEQGRERRIDVSHEPARGIRLGRDDDVVGLQRRTQAAEDVPAAAATLDAVDAVLEHHGARRQARRERGDELLHAVLKRHEEAPARPARPRLRRAAIRPPEPEDDGPLAPLELSEPWHRRRQREIVGIGGVDSGDQRLGDALQRLAAESATYEGAQALVVAHAPRQDEIEGHAQLARPGEETRPDERSKLRRRQELEAIRQRMQTAGAPHEHLSEAIVRRHEPVLDTEPAAERQRPRLFREERVGPRLDEESTGVAGRDGAAAPVARLDERQLELGRSLPRELDGAMRRREPGDSAANDGELYSLHRPPPWTPRTRSASIATNSGWSFTAAARWSSSPTPVATRRASTSRS